MAAHTTTMEEVRNVKSMEPYFLVVHAIVHTRLGPICKQIATETRKCSPYLKHGVTHVMIHCGIIGGIQVIPDNDRRQMFEKGSLGQLF